MTMKNKDEVSGAVGELPPLPAPTRRHYGLHYSAEDMEQYAIAARAALLASQPTVAATLSAQRDAFANAIDRDAWAALQKIIDHPTTEGNYDAFYQKLIAVRAMTGAPAQQQSEQSVSLVKYEMMKTAYETELSILRGPAKPAQFDPLEVRALAKSFRENPREASLTEQAMLRQAATAPVVQGEQPAKGEK